MESETNHSTRILFVAPYENLGNLFQKLIEKYPQFSADVVIGNLEEGVERTKERLEHETYALIISRGGTSELIKRITQIPVIQVPITTSDVLMALKLTERYTEKFAVVGFPSITQYASEIKDLLQRDYEIVSFEQVDEIENILATLKEQGISMILGDFITYNIARSMGINSVLIHSWEESIEIAINQAEAVTETLLNANVRIGLIKNILNTHHAYFAIFGSNNEILEKSLPPGIDEQELLSYVRSNLPAFLSGSAKFATYRFGQSLLAFRSTQVTTPHPGYVLVSIYIDDWNEISKKQGIQLISEQMNSSSPYHSNSTSLGNIQQLLQSYRNTSKVVVLIGEKGTGKLAAARKLHQLSIHQNKPFYLIDCYRMHLDAIQLNTNQFNLPDSKGTSIIFNNFQDATPAVKNQILDFIDQEQRGMENRFYITVSSSHSKSETQIDLKNILKQISRSFPFLTIEVPSLRDRKEDLLNLITLYLSEFRGLYNKPVTGFKDEAMDKLLAYDWPGNMDQLKRVLEELCLQASSYYISERQVSEILEKEKRIFSPEDLPHSLPMLDLTQPLSIITRDVVKIVLHQENMNKTKAAERLEIGRSTIWRILKRTG